MYYGFNKNHGNRLYSALLPEEGRTRCMCLCHRACGLVKLLEKVCNGYRLHTLPTNSPDSVSLSLLLAASPRTHLGGKEWRGSRRKGEQSRYRRC